MKLMRRFRRALQLVEKLNTETASKRSSATKHALDATSLDEKFSYASMDVFYYCMFRPQQHTQEKMRIA